ncbi:MAG: ATP-grasp domain-containing protein [Streptosporangiaceae bacterium]
MSLLILGASEDQLPLYREARRRGIQIIAADHRRDRPATPFADTFLQVSVRDPDAIAAALGGIRPRAVVSAASDAGLRSWHELSRRYDTPYRYPGEAARTSMDKAEFHRLLEKLGLPGFRWACGTSTDDISKEDLYFPLIVKPNDGSGSKGLSRVGSADELAAAVIHARDHSPDGIVIAEELIKGDHYSLEIFMVGDRPRFAAVTEKVFAEGFLVRTHLCPSRLSETLRLEAAENAARICAALDLHDGPANLDFVVTPEGRVNFVELNARLGGNGIPRLLKAAYGVDLVAALISLVLGEPADLRPTHQAHAALTLLGSPLTGTGTVTGFGGVEAARAVPGIAELELFVQPGDLVRPFTQAGHKIGNLLAAGGSRAETERSTREALRLLRPVIVPSPESEAHARS